MKTETPVLHFSAALYKIKTQTILRLPESTSRQLPSRGQVAVAGIINGHEFKTVLEPDGYLGHFLKISRDLQKTASVSAGDTVEVELIVTKDWPEPEIPQDVANALKTSPQKVRDKWQDITAMARWEWIRWINETKNPDTRIIRIEKTISKLNGKHRRPCCFNLAACTDPELSKSSRLIEV